ncbi:P-loop containing nucleoside triphosphate hydrolase [Glarea lozoyensis ATCC 20868]|uniref:p-loop containing nucleoside triphosphate hydrolase n=1 Tax=Glarea lozoyensis (strain ATCC 20868 / MF5171) TaxID=1116229 RepID=S3D1F0_GLAL2|nr:P-loop containing nucleoside triphosphate hydrolase [Glarea lozoyensis ATCC 20868]EPE30994.1 P-loop containing nucleoside triphosphate hydrolase [Glarea lozoyensis ATCC 20868]
MSSPMTQRTALGQNATIGALYDARRDEFLPRTLFNSSLPDDAVLMGGATKTTVHLSNMDTYKEKFDDLGITSELAASILSGIVVVGGSGHYLTEQRMSNNTLQAAINFKVSTVHEKLNLMSPSLRTNLAITSVSNNEATHVVTEIEYGAQSFITAQCQSPDGRNDGQLQAQFRADVDAFKQQLEASFIHANGTPRSYPGSRLPLTISAYADMLSDNGIAIQDFEEASRFLGLIPDHIKQQNNGKGHPIIYTLVPIAMLPLFLPITVNSGSNYPPPSVDCLQQFVTLFDQLAESQRRMNDYESYVARNKLYLPEAHVRLVSDRIASFLAAQTKLRSDYARVLQNVRSGLDEPARLWDLLKSSDMEDCKPQSVKDLVETHRQKVDFITEMVLAGATYIGYNHLDEKIEISRYHKDDVYIFSFNETSMKDPKILDGNKQLLLEILQDHSHRSYVAIVDYDAKGKSLEACRTSQYRDGKEVTGDMLEHRLFMAEKSFARYSQKSLDTKVVQKPLQRRFVKIACPGNNCNANEVLDWICFQCHAPVEFGFSDAYMYCDCGRSLFTSYDFRCSGAKHGEQYVRYEKDVLQVMLKSLTSDDNLNILILGETGVGKSTFINAFVNYLSYETLPDAMKADGLNWVIPCSFSTQKMDRNDPNSKIEQIKVKVGSRDDEQDGAKGASATQQTTVYPVTIGTRTIRLIDTPGIGDTRGLEYDQKNMADILNTLSSYEELHGILILLKSNNARLTTMFSFCVTELLTHLHRDSARNMAFGFTNTRISNYTPGDTFGSLETLLGRHPNVGLELTMSTTYCFDSESFRYLAAYKNGVFMENEEDFKRSWEHSRAEATRLLEHFESHPPHLVKSTISLNSTRELISQMTVPMAEISQLINTNISLVQDHKKALGDERLKGDALRKRLQIQKVQFVTHILDQPRTVCTEAACTECRDDGNQESKNLTIYKTHCHAPCYLENVKCDTKADPGLVDCAAFSNGYCNGCGHNWQQHMHVLYELHEQTGIVKDLEIEKQLNDHADDLTIRQAATYKAEKLINEYEGEHAQIQKAAAQFGLFLKKYSITPYNDATLDYLDVLIKEENGKVQAGGNTRKLDTLKKDRAKHVEIIKVLTESMKSDPNCRLLDEHGVNQLVTDLYSLPHFGRNLKSVKRSITAAHEATYRERPYRVKGSRGHMRTSNHRHQGHHARPLALPSRPNISAHAQGAKSSMQDMFSGMNRIITRPTKNFNAPLRSGSVSTAGSYVQRMFNKNA